MCCAPARRSDGRGLWRTLPSPSSRSADPRQPGSSPRSSCGWYRGSVPPSRLGDLRTTGSVAHDGISNGFFGKSRLSGAIQARTRDFSAGIDTPLANPGKLPGKPFPGRKMCRFIVAVAGDPRSEATCRPEQPGGKLRPKSQDDWGEVLAKEPRQPGGCRSYGGPLPPGDGRRHGPRSPSERGRLTFGRHVHARNAASRVSPRSVRIDSGCVWTPSTGSVRWRSPISTPSPVYAVATRSSGRSVTTSEW